MGMEAKVIELARGTAMEMWNYLAGSMEKPKVRNLIHNLMRQAVQTAILQIETKWR